MKKLLSLALFLCALPAVYAQSKKQTQLKPVSASDFMVNSPVVDSNENVVILDDIGSTDFEGNNSGNFDVIFKQRKRLLLRNRNGFGEATVKIPIYSGRSSDQEEHFNDFEATTYNLVNGQVVATKLDKSSLFTEKETREYNVRKFTFPNIKEGSIIEYQYTIKSPFYLFSNIRAWAFQDEYPVLRSEYQVSIPYMFNYVMSRRGYLPYAKDTVWKSYKSYQILDNGGTGSSEIYHVAGDGINAIWMMKDVPAFKPESYTSSVRNHRNAISFQLSSIRYSPENTRYVLKDWYETASSLLKDEDFGLALTQDNNWISDPALNIPTSVEPLERARKVFAFVRDNFKCTDHDAVWLSQTLKKTFQTRTGKVSDVNLLLTAIYRKLGFDAQPVLVSTRDNGYPQEETALLRQFNYVITRLKIGAEYYVLDASRANTGFGRLPMDVYNISGRVVDESQPVIIPLSADSLTEKSLTNVVLINGEKGYGGESHSLMGYFQSADLRNKLKEQKKEDYFKELKKSMSSEVELSGFGIDSLNLYDEPATVYYDMNFKFNDEDVLYFSPMMGHAWNKNPFTAAERLYPVEMPYKIDETYLLNMEIPKGYKVDELPKSTRIKLNEDEGMFEYLFAQTPTELQFRCRLKLNKATFTRDDYNTLRDFFSHVVKKEQEQIVFKKVK